MGLRLRWFYSPHGQNSKGGGGFSKKGVDTDVYSPYAFSSYVTMASNVNIRVHGTARGWSIWHRMEQQDPT